MKSTPKIPVELQRAAEQHKVPTIVEIYSNDSIPVLKKDAQLQTLLNQEPKPEWVKLHPMTREPYIPIERVEWLLTNIFLRWRVEIKDTKLIANSVAVTVRLWYFDHVTKEWLWQDGLGAAPLQTDKGAGATDFNAIKSSAVQIGAPAAESYAVKDAAEKIGKIFGKDLNRKEVISYQSLENKYDKILAND